jgi:hypothetical protein
MVYAQEELVFILEYYFASKLFAAICEVFSSAYPDKELLNKTIKMSPVSLHILL